MIAGILGSMQSLCWCILLMFILMFMYSLVVLQVISDDLLSSDIDDDQKDRILLDFGSLQRCLYTLCLSITGGVNWGIQSGALIALNSALGLLHILFMYFCILCVLNVVTSVFVDKASQFTKADVDSLLMDEMSQRENWIGEMRALFQQAEKEDEDEDDDEAKLVKLNEDEFLVYIEDKRVQAYFRRVGLHVEKENAKALFRMIDLDDSGTVGLEEFVDGCSQFVGNARQLDIARLRHENRVISQQLVSMADSVRELKDAYTQQKNHVSPILDGPRLPPPKAMGASKMLPKKA